MGARMTIQMAHRYGALITFFYIGFFSLYLLAIKVFKKLAALILFLLVLQIVLGILNVIWLLPVQIAVLHNGIAAILLLTIVSLVSEVYRKPLP